MRRLKPYLVSKVTDHNTGHYFEVMLDREEKTFFAEVLGTMIKAPTAGECTKLAQEHLSAATEMKWEKIVVIHASQRHGYDGLKLSYDVHEVAKKPGKVAEHDGWWTERHKIPIFRGKDHGYSYRDFYRGTSNPDQGLFVLPWSVPVEAALKDLMARIEDAKTKLREILGQDNAAEKIAEAACKLLPAPKK